MDYQSCTVFQLTDTKRLLEAQLILSPDHNSNQELRHCTVGVLEPSVYTVASETILICKCMKVKNKPFVKFLTKIP
jgi:hypothetical protein